MRLFSCAVVLASFASLGAFAADLDPHRHRQGIVRPPPAPEVSSVEQVYSRPVVGFYGYPYDYLVRVPPPTRADPQTAQPYIRKRDTPQRIEVE